MSKYHSGPAIVKGAPGTSGRHAFSKQKIKALKTKIAKAKKVLK